MNLKTLSDDRLLSETTSLVKQERECTLLILKHLREIERRRLFSTLKYSSLFAYVVGELGYPEDQAYRRVAAMRLMKEQPEIEHELESGRLTLTHVGLAQAAFAREKKAGRVVNMALKTETLKQLSGLSTREAKRLTLTLFPENARPDQARAISEEQVEFRFTGSVALAEKIEKLQGRMAHKNPHLSLGELVEQLCDLALKELDHGRPVKKPRLGSHAEISRDIWRRDKGQCTNCGSGHAVEKDHKIPQALGGESTLENQRLLCRSCNQRAAIEKLGINKMQKYLREPAQAYH